VRLAQYILEDTGYSVDPASMFDTQVKRLHEYKRQHLNLLFADYQPYVDTQDQVSATFLDQEKWSKMSIYNAARMGKFSSDRAIQEYCRNIWAVTGLQGV
jgi:glucan phosphorylase